MSSHSHVFQPVEYLCQHIRPDDAAFFNLDEGHYCARQEYRPATLIFYSLGNFVSRMKTPMCKIGVIASVSIEKNFYSGRVEFQLDEMEFVYNQTPKFPGKKHRLMLYTEYFLPDQDIDRKRVSKIRKESEFAIRHIKGSF